MRNPSSSSDIKFVTADDTFKPAALRDDTPYTVMFGPDKCGATNKVRAGGRADGWLHASTLALKAGGLGGCIAQVPAQAEGRSTRAVPCTPSRLSTGADNQAMHCCPPPPPPPQVHLILRHKSPKTGKVEEKHLAQAPFIETDKKTHVYTAILRASNNRCARSTGRLAGPARAPWQAAPLPPPAEGLAAAAERCYRSAAAGSAPAVGSRRPAWETN